MGALERELRRQRRRDVALALAVFGVLAALVGLATRAMLDTAEPLLPATHDSVSRPR